MSAFLIDYLTIVKAYRDVGLVFLEIWRGGQGDTLEKTAFKKPSLITIKTRKFFSMMFVADWIMLRDLFSNQSNF